MILDNRDLMIDALRYMWVKNPNAARAVYLRYIKDCKYQEIAQELQLSTARARQLSMSGLSKMRNYLNRKYGKSIALGA